jgi:hypothetical protein
MSAPTPYCPPAKEPTSPPAEEPTTIKVSVNAQDAGLTADAHVINVNALGLLNDGINVGVHADLSLLGCTSDVGVDACVSIAAPSLCDVADCVPAVCPADLDVCSLTNQLGI